MKNQERSPEFKVSAYDFLLTPRTLALSKEVTGCFTLELDRGPQVMKRFEEQILPKGQANLHQFVGKQSGKMRFHTEKSFLVGWSVYRERNDHSQYLDTLPCDLLVHYTRYVNAFKAQSRDYAKIQQIRAVGQDISKLWEITKEHIPSSFQGLKAGKSGGFELTFDLQIRCQLDYVAEAEKHRSSKSLRSAASKSRDMDEEILPAHSQIEDKPADLRMELQNNKVLVAQQSSESLYKPSSALSDIPESSNECSSKNFGDKANKLVELADIIPEQEHQTSSPFIPSIRTHNFGSTYDQDLLKRRSLTDNSNHSEEMGEAQYLGGYENHLDRELEKEELRIAGLETAPHSEIKMEVKSISFEDIPVKKPKFCMKLLLVLALGAFVFGSMALLVTNLNSSPYKQKEEKLGKMEKTEKMKKGAKKQSSVPKKRKQK